MTDNETISNEDDKIKDHLVRESKHTCIIWEKQFFLTRYMKQETGSSVPRTKNI